MPNSKRNYGKSLASTLENVIKESVLPAGDTLKSQDITQAISLVKQLVALGFTSMKITSTGAVITATLTWEGIVTFTVSNSAKQSVKNSTNLNSKSSKTTRLQKKLKNTKKNCDCFKLVKGIHDL